MVKRKWKKVQVSHGWATKDERKIVWTNLCGEFQMRAYSSKANILEAYYHTKRTWPPKRVRITVEVEE